MADQYLIRLPALQIRQGEQFIYSFGIDGKRLHEFTTVSRVHREDDHKLMGYQRPEVLSHIRAIRRYLESEKAILPNAIVLAFNERVRFEPAKTRTDVDYCVAGEIVIPVDEALPEDEKPAWLVDGQQRSAAIRDADLAEFPIAAVGFIAEGQEEQRSQFILVNNTKPLPKGLIHELLPDTTGHLPAAYARKQLPAQILAALNFGAPDEGRPFAGRIATPTNATGYIKDNSVLRMIENSLYDGALYQYRNAIDGSGEMEDMLLHLNYFWTVVQVTFPEAWNLPPTKSRLTHGVGIQALGYLMDSLTDGIRARDLAAVGIEPALQSLRNECAWTSGSWIFAPDDARRWNGLQNTPSDVRTLSNFVVRTVRRRTTT